MARIIALTNHKGGTGKTTTAVNLAAALQLRGYDVLVIDFDGQANATELLGVEAQPNATTYAAMKSKYTPFITPVRVYEREKGAGVLDVLPSCYDLSALDVELANEPDRVTRFRTVTEKYRDKYDVIIIDTPPTLGLALVSVLYAADEIIITIQAEYLAVRGLVTLTDKIQTINANRPFPLDVHALLTMYDKRKGLHRNVAERVAASGIPAYETKIRNSVSICEAQAARLDIVRFNPKSNGAIDYAAFTDEYLHTHPLKHNKHSY